MASAATGLATVLPATPAAATDSPVPMLWLDATNPASYPGSGTTWTDLSPNHRDGTVSGSGITYDATNHAMQFPGGTNGTAWVDLAGEFADFSNGITIEFEGEFGAARSNWERIFDFAAGLGATDDAFWVGQMWDSNELALETWHGGDNQGRCHTATGGEALGAPNSRTYAKWMITVGGDTPKCRIYKDGVELPTQVKNPDYSADTAEEANGSDYPLPTNVTRESNFLGRSNWVGDDDFEGSIRYIRLYSTVLTPDQAQQNASATVTFDANGGTGTMGEQTRTSEGALTLNAFTRSDFYTFAGWNTRQDGNGTSYGDGAIYPFSSSTTLYAQWAPPVTSGDITEPGEYFPLTPARVLDTRTTTRLVGGTPIEVTVTGANGVPANGVTAVTMNATVTGASGLGYLSAYSCDMPRPNVSNVNYLAGETIADLVTVKVPTNGKVCLYSHADADVILDVNGYFSAEANGAGYQSVTPSRTVDTRLGAGTKALAGSEVEVTAPAGAAAIAVNLTVTDADADGHVTAYPCGTSRPMASNVNYVAGQTIANSAVVKVGDNGKVCVYTYAAAHVIVDLTGKFIDDGGVLFVARAPERLLDTRTANAVASGQTVEVTFADLVSSVNVNSDQYGAATLTVTATDATSDGYVTAYQCGTTRPETSNLNFVAGRAISAQVTVPMASASKICLYVEGTTHLLGDWSGRYVALV